MRVSILMIFILISTLNATTMFEKAIQRATKDKKLILVEIYSQYCNYSKDMKRKVLRKGDVLKIIHQHYIYYRFNIDNDDKRELPKNLYTEKTPTYFFLSSDGKETLEEIIGEMKKEDFKYFLIETYKDSLVK